jgi:hypothetical protein
MTSAVRVMLHTVMASPISNSTYLEAGEESSQEEIAGFEL